MAAITSGSIRFSGTVTFDDNTTQYWHVQYEGGFGTGGQVLWSTDQAASQEALRQVSWYLQTVGNLTAYWYWGYILMTIDSLPFLNFVWDTTVPITRKTITDANFRLDMVVALDDNTVYPVSIVSEGLSNFHANTEIRIETPDLASSATNLATVKSVIETVFEYIMDSPANVVVS